MEGAEAVVEGPMRKWSQRAVRRSYDRPLRMLRFHVDDGWAYQLKNPLGNNNYYNIASMDKRGKSVSYWIAWTALICPAFFPKKIPRHRRRMVTGVGVPTYGIGVVDGRYFQPQLHYSTP